MVEQTGGLIFFMGQAAGYKLSILASHTCAVYHFGTFNTGSCIYAAAIIKKQ